VTPRPYARTFAELLIDLRGGPDAPGWYSSGCCGSAAKVPLGGWTHERGMASPQSCRNRSGLRFKLAVNPLVLKRENFEVPVDAPWFG